jgi:broad specificity phosphatase PhoE
MAVELVYETHTPTTDNEAGISTGWLPGELSEAGRREARELGELWRGRDIAAVISSDLERSADTARIAFPDGAPPIHFDARLRECDYGDLNGKPSHLVQAQRIHHIEEPFPGGQSYRQVVAATEAFLRDLVAHWDGKRVMLIAHTANQWALDVLLRGARLEDLLAAPFDWDPGRTYVVSANRGH